MPAPLQPATGCLLGAYPGKGNADPQVSFEPNVAGRQLACWYRYYAFAQNVPTADDLTVAAGGRHLVMSLVPAYPPAPANPSQADSVTVAAGSDGQSSSTLNGAGTVWVSSVTGYPSSGTLDILTTSGAVVSLSYAGISGLSLTGCSLTAGSGILHTGDPAAIPYTYPGVTAGIYDGRLAAIALAASSLPNAWFLVFQPEPDLTARNGYGSAAQFIPAFQHVVTQLAAVCGRGDGPGQFASIFCTSNAGNTGYAFYPGDGYCDWYGSDLYDPTLAKGSPSATYTPLFTYLNTDPLSPSGGLGSGGGHGKPLAVNETGVDNTVSDSSEATWINAVPSALSSLSTTWGSKIQLWMWFNSSGGLGDTSILYPTSSSAAYAAIGAQAFFNPVRDGDSALGADAAAVAGGLAVTSADAASAADQAYSIGGDRSGSADAQGLTVTVSSPDACQALETAASPAVVPVTSSDSASAADQSRHFPADGDSALAAEYETRAFPADGDSASAREQETRAFPHSAETALAGDGSSAPAFPASFTSVQSGQNVPGPPSDSAGVSLPAGVSQGNLAVACLSWPSSATLTGLSGWTLAASSAGPVLSAAVCYLPVTAGAAGGTSWSFTFSAPVTAEVTAREWSAGPGWAAAPLDVTAAASSPGAQDVDSGRAPGLGRPGELAVAALAYAGDAQPESGLPWPWQAGNEVIAAGLATLRELTAAPGNDGPLDAHFSVPLPASSAGCLAAFAAVPAPSDGDAGHGGDGGEAVTVSLADSAAALDAAPAPATGTPVTSADAASARDLALGFTGGDYARAADGGESTGPGHAADSDAAFSADAQALTARPSSAEAARAADGQESVAGTTLPKDADLAHGEDAGFSFLSAGGAARGADGQESVTASDYDAAAAGDPETSRHPADGDSASAVLEAFSAWPRDADACSGDDENQSSWTWLASDSCLAADAAPTVDVYAFQPSFRWTGGGYAVVLEHPLRGPVTVWRGERPAREALGLAAGRFAHDGDSCRARDAGGTGLVVTLSAAAPFTVHVWARVLTPAGAA